MKKSQNHEDLYLHRIIFKHYYDHRTSSNADDSNLPILDPNHQFFFFEIGALNGIQYSNSYLFEQCFKIYVKSHFSIGKKPNFCFFFFSEKIQRQSKINDQQNFLTQVLKQMVY